MEPSIYKESVGALVSTDYRRAAVFQQFGIDFCCGGQRSFLEACQQAGADPQAVEQALLVLKHTQTGFAEDYTQWPLDFLVDYIINIHHHYVRKRLPEILPMAQKVAQVHADTDPHMVEVLDRFTLLAQELTDHLQEEEETIFPYVKELRRAQRHGETLPALEAHIVRALEDEHTLAGNLMREIRQLTGGYVAPAHACTTYTTLYALLQEFEADLHKHVHLENNVLFPAVLSAQ